MASNNGMNFRNPGHEDDSEVYDIEAQERAAARKKKKKKRPSTHEREGRENSASSSDVVDQSSSFDGRGSSHSQRDNGTRRKQGSEREVGRRKQRSERSSGESRRNDASMTRAESASSPDSKPRRPSQLRDRGSTDQPRRQDTSRRSRAVPEPDRPLSREEATDRKTRRTDADGKVKTKSSQKKSSYQGLAGEEEFNDHEIDDGTSRRGDNGRRRKKENTEFMGNPAEQNVFVSSRGGASAPSLDKKKEGGYDDGTDLAVAELVSAQIDYQPGPVYMASKHDPAKAQKKLMKKKKSRMRTYILAGLVVAAVLILVVVLVVTRKNKKTTPQTGSNPTQAPTQQRTSCIASKIESALLSDPSVLNDPTSPQSRALDWITYEDPGGLLDCFAPTLLQRWALAVFYYSTTKDNAQWLSCFPSDDPTDTNCIAKELDRDYVIEDGSFLEIDPSLYVDVADQKQWLKDGNECLWWGIECSTEGDVGILSLSNNLKGTIPREIGVLTDLGLIRLELNFLTGPLPTELGLLDNLYGLEVQYNELSGIIPDEIYDLTLMTIINVAKNKNIGGTISSRIGQLMFLTAFYTSGNIIKGSIPSQIGNLLDLERVWMFDNKLTGTIPTEIGNLVNLIEFNIGFNSFIGSIPTFVGQLENLETLRLDSNKLDGSLPVELYNLESLKDLLLGLNSFTGQISTSIGQLTSMENLSVQENELTGPIPTEIGSMLNLVVVFLNQNKLTGPVPVEICQLRYVFQADRIQADCGEQGALSSGLGFNSCDCCTLCCDRDSPKENCLLV
mmetsp:Transcript_1558/g.2787  ORF Transcript_1558/g.2787 Transcript_1558/m.2787 type:complete len:787 (-) Transcript_1558:300-2660(-)